MEEIDESALEGKTSKINSAMLVNLTLNNIWIEFYRYFTHGQYLSANSELDCVWTILGGEEKIEGTDIEKNYNKIEEELGKTGALKDSLQTRGFNKITEGHLKILQNQKKVLLKKALFLRRLQNKQGKGTAYDTGEDEETE